MRAAQQPQITVVVAPLATSERVGRYLASVLPELPARPSGNIPEAPGYDPASLAQYLREQAATDVSNPAAAQALADRKAELLGR